MSKYDNAGLVMIPSGYKASKVYSVIPNTTDGDFDFSRGSTATRINKDGLIEVVASNVPRLDYPLIDGVVQDCPSLLLEPQRTNYIPYSTLDFNGGVKPNGWLIGFGTGSYSYEQLTYKGQKAVKQTQITTGRSYLETGTITILANTEHTLKIQFILDECVADPTDYIVVILGFGIDVSYQFSDIDENGILEFQYNPLSDNIGNIRIGLGGNGNEDGGKSLAWAIPQLEAGSYPTSYIPTSGSTVTRVAETCNGAGTSDTFNDSEGVLMFEMSALADDSTTRVITINDSSNQLTERVQLFILGSSMYGRVTDGGVTQGEVIGTPTLINNNKIAFKYKLNDFALWINGIEIDTSNLGTTPSGLNTIRFDAGSGGSPFYGNTKQLITFNKALTDAELEDLTSWDSFLEMATSQLYTIN